MDGPHHARVAARFSPNFHAEPETPELAALRLWLTWHERHARLTEQLFAAGRDRREQEWLLDALDTLRQEAVAQTEALLHVRCRAA